MDESGSSPVERILDSPIQIKRTQVELFFNLCPHTTKYSIFDEEITCL